MNRYIRLYGKLISLNFATLMAYRGNFVNNFLSSLSWGFFSLYSVVLLTSQIQSLFGWKREELLLLNALYGVIIGFYHVMFSGNFERFSALIHFGQLDSYLLKPVDSQFLLTFWKFNFAATSRILIAFLYASYLIGQLGVAVSPLSVASFIVLLIVSLGILYSLWFIASTTLIWFTRLSNIIELLFTITGSARYPQEMFREFSIYVFVFLLPLTLVITTPAKVLLQRIDVISLGTFFALAVFFVIASRKFWKFALRSYTSASS
jgi:ABC-2 type transport system permease protein